MTDIPDTWPPAGHEGTVVPMFPLQGVFLLPRQVMPLHVFEPRYKQMVEDVLDGPGRVIMGTVLENEEWGPDNEVSPPRVLQVAGLGEIARHEKTPDGRYYIWLFGLGRHTLEEVDSDRPYRKVRARPLLETEPSKKETRELNPLLRDALVARGTDGDELPDDIPISVLADALSQKLRLPQGEMEQIFCESDIAERARLVLAANTNVASDEDPADDADE